MCENLKLIGQLYNETLIYLNAQKDVYSVKVKYKAFVSLVIETKKAELEKSIAQCFNDHGQIISDISIAKKKVEILKTTTKKELKLLV